MSRPGYFIWLWLLIGVVVCGALGVQTARADGQAQFEPAPCPFANITAIRIDCGWISVAEDHAKPTGPHIRLAVAIIRALGVNHQPDPLFYLAGGPGSGVVWMTPRLAVGLAQTTRDVVLIDQRGMGYSEPSLDCPTISDWAFLSGAPIASDIAACRATLEAKDIHLPLYNTEQNAADIADVRIALGYAQINLFGVSYGTRLALTVLRDHPDGIRSVTLDSTHPPQLMYGEETGTQSNFERSFGVLEGMCQRDTLCRLAYPDLKATYLATYQRLTVQPQVVQVSGQRVTVNAALFETLIFNNLYRPNTLATLPALIYSVADGDDTLLRRALEPLVRPAQGQGRSLGTTLTIVCSESAALNGSAPLESDAAFAHPLPALDGDATLRNCRAWGIDHAQRAAPAVNSTISVLILAGDFDPVTNPDWGVLAARTLARATYVRLPNLGHGIADSECGGAIFAGFLDQPESPVDVSCAQNVPAPAFALDAGHTRPIALGLIILCALVGGWGLSRAVRAGLAGTFRPAWNIAFRKVGWLGMVVGALSIPLPIALVIIPLIAGVQAAAIFAPDDEPALEVQLAAPRGVLWVVGERLAVVLLMYGALAALRSLVVVFSVPGENFLVVLAQIAVPVFVLSGVGLFAALRSRIPLFGMMAVLLIGFSFSNFGDFFLPGQPFGAPLNLIQPFFWTIHLYLKPSDLGYGYFWLSRVALVSIGAALMVLASRTLRSPEQILIAVRTAGTRQSNHAKRDAPAVNNAAPTRLIWTPQPVQARALAQLAGVIRGEYRLAWGKRPVIVVTVILFAAVLIGGTLVSGLLNSAMLVNPTTLSPEQARHMATLNAIMSTWPMISVVLLFVAPLVAAEAIPYDRQTGITELLGGLPYGVYLAGKIIGMVLVVLTALAGAIVFSVALWFLKTGGLDWLPFLDMWIIGGGLAILLNVPLAILLGSTQNTRLRGAGVVFVGFVLLTILASLSGASFLSPLRPALFDYYLNLFGSGVLNPANLAINSALTAPGVQLVTLVGAIEILGLAGLAHAYYLVRQRRG